METEEEGEDDEEEGEFKSYYVVWKRMKKYRIQWHKWSLNRTMQYGNEKKVTKKTINISV